MTLILHDLHEGEEVFRQVFSLLGLLSCIQHRAFLQKVLLDQF